MPKSKGLHILNKRTSRKSKQTLYKGLHRSMRSNLNGVGRPHLFREWSTCSITYSMANSSEYHQKNAESSESSDHSSDDSDSLVDEDEILESPIEVQDGVYYCMACNKSMSGSIPLEAHEESNKHCQLVEQWRENLSEPNNEMPERCDSTYCSICNVHLSGKISAEQHYVGNTHKKQNKLIYHSGHTPSQLNERSINKLHTGDAFLQRGCFPCRILCFTSIVHAQMHFAGKRHRKQAMGWIPAPVKKLPPMKLKPPKDKPISVDSLTSTKSRNYQRELYMQAMESRNAVIFLQTGTGKTLVAAMIARTMLVMNPGRQVVFLVDKILLCIQQSDYLEKELGVSYLSTIPKIARLCGGGRTISANEHISQYDIVVVTGEYFRNLLRKKTMFWENICLIVFDEAHHCHKDHPYNMIMKDYYKKSDHKPKVVGLSASPVGLNTKEATESVLSHLLANLGDAELACVVENWRELEGFRSKSKLEVKAMKLDPKLDYLLNKLKVLARKSFKRLRLHYTELGGLLHDRHIEDNDLLSSGTLIEVLDALSELYDEQHEVNYLSFLLTNISHLRNGECPHEVEDLLLAIDSNVICSYSSAFVSDISETQMEAIVNELYLRFCKYRVNESEPLALIMVQTRMRAMQLTERLNSHDFFVDHGIQATKLVGHGGGNVGENGKVAGMSVSQQRGTLEKIKNKRYQVIIATSVAEEGIDLPECDLVILLYTPSTTTSLVQLRGRARKKHSRMVILQPDATRNDVDALLDKEARMEKAITNIFNQQRRKKLEEHNTSKWRSVFDEERSSRRESQTCEAGFSVTTIGGFWWNHQ
ncbi:endoribonuclease Dicer homolog 3a-like [Anneissia japonica]|uniref:endoribonuclease Dicer homolog 3a-like n=1 Tax=Anneissia japonica TaxID=1529436 RepID=UPI001425AD08|nr:endoribonuclease Dicer homolog 3a-like [Anneissia japonica]